MNSEEFDCVFDWWTGFAGKATCEVGFLKCNEMSCPAYIPRQKKKPMTHFDEIKAMSVEELATFIRDQIIDRNIGIPAETWLSWLKAPADKEGE